MATEELVTEQFQFLGIEVSKEVLGKCVSLCAEYDVDAETFIEQWMAFSLTALNGAGPTLENLNLLEKREFCKRSASRNAPANEVQTTGTSLTVYGAPASIQSENEVLSNYISDTPRALDISSRNRHRMLCEVIKTRAYFWQSMGFYLVAQYPPVTRSTLIDCWEDHHRFKEDGKQK